MHEHATKPATLAPACQTLRRLAAWIGEKIVAWSSTRPDGSPAFDRELLLGTSPSTGHQYDHDIAAAYWATATCPAQPPG